ncbi:MAG: hypothetical protein WAW59_06475 [Patescibacteria group bacterium]
MQKSTVVPIGTPSYTIRSHGGIGDEHPSEDGAGKQEHNLSGSCHELVVDFQ